jgi:hypothetical protein
MSSGGNGTATFSGSSEPDHLSQFRTERRQLPGRSERREQEVRVRRVTGFDRRRGGFPARLSEQCRQALQNGSESLAAAGLSMQDVVRVVYLVRDADAFPACFPLLRDAFGDARPAATLRLVGDFDVPDVKIELELIARGETGTSADA